MTIFIPLGTGSNWGNNELKYCLRSLEENLLDDFEVICYYQKKPNLNIKGRKIDRWYPQKAYYYYNRVKNYENYFDVLNKVDKFVNSNDCPEYFLYLYDDILLINKIVSNEIFNLPQFKVNEKSYLYNEKSKWGRTVNEALRLSNGALNFEHHLPMIYKRDLLKEMFNKFPIKEQLIPYALGTLYFNFFPQESSNIHLNDLPNYKCGFEGMGGYMNRQCVYKQDSVEEIESVVKNKIFCNYNDEALAWKAPEYPLKKWIELTFNKPSRYEFRP
jgi:hypothetical protein